MLKEARYEGWYDNASFKSVWLESIATCRVWTFETSLIYCTDFHARFLERIHATAKDVHIKRYELLHFECLNRHRIL